MSDLLAPIYAVLQDDALAFWAFAGFMERMARNFVRDQSGMRAQLTSLDNLVQILDPKLYLHLQKADSTNFFFFFRMLLVWFKREFEWGDVLRLWEVLWTDYLSSQMHLFVALAVLERHRDVVMEHLERFDEVLKYFNELSGTIELKSTLLRAEGLFRRFERTVEAVDKKSNFPVPGPGLRQRGESAAAAAGASSSSSSISNSKPKTPGADFVSGNDAVVPSLGASSSVGDAVAKGAGGVEKVKIISPELRLLMSRKVITLERIEEGRKQGDEVRASGLRD